VAVLDRVLIDRELTRRGISARRLARLAGITESTVSHARSGRAISPTTLRQITEALASVPPLSLSLVAPDEMAS
jgi:transcriptional regulator with XRE-family HTH domain